MAPSCQVVLRCVTMDLQTPRQGEALVCFTLLLAMSSFVGCAPARHDTDAPHPDPNTLNEAPKRTTTPPHEGGREKALVAQKAIPSHRKKETYREVWRKNSRFGDIIVFDHKGYRCLAFEDPQEMQSCVHKKRKLDFRFEYIEMMFATALLPQKMNRALVLGLGGAALPRLLTAVYPKAHIHVVEIEPLVVQAAKKLMAYTPTNKTRLFVQDAAAFVRKKAQKLQKKVPEGGASAPWRKKVYDLILVDCYDADDIPKHLLTKAFIRNLAALTSPQGVVAVNLAADAPHYTTTVSRYTDVFPRAWLMRGRRSANHILIVGQTLPTPKRCVKRARALDKKKRLPFSLTNTLNTLGGSWKKKGRTR